MTPDESLAGQQPRMKATDSALAFFHTQAHGQWARNRRSLRLVVKLMKTTRILTKTFCVGQQQKRCLAISRLYYIYRNGNINKVEIQTNSIFRPNKYFQTIKINLSSSPLVALNHATAFTGSECSIREQIFSPLLRFQTLIAQSYVPAQ